MKRFTAFFLTLLTVWALQAAPVVAQFNRFSGCDREGFCTPKGGPPAPATCTESTNFIARTSGLNTTHKNAYHVLICGLVTDGIFAQLDMLHIYATQDTATAQLNLVSSSYSAVLNGSPTFTVDRGYTGVDASSTVYINSQFNPLTASSPKFTQNNAHMSYWSNTNVQSSASGGLAMGSTGGGTSTYIFSRYPTDIMGFRINGTNVAGTTNTDSTGHYLGTRTGTSTLAGYKNGAVVQGPAGDGVGTPHNSNILIMAISNAGTPAFGSGMQFTMASIGNTLNSTQVGNFYTRLRTYMTTMGVP